MLDFNNLNNSNYDFQEFYGNAGAPLTQYQTWRKPRGAKFIYIICVGGGSSGGTGGNTAAAWGGGAGGGSGAQSTVLMPALFVPDTLYIQAGMGGNAVSTSAGVGVAGTASYVLVEPLSAMANACCIAYANPGAATGTASSATAGGAAGSAAAVATIAMMPLAGRGHYSFYAGQAGAAGGGISGAAGGAVTVPVTGLMVTGGSGGGGTTSGNGGIITGAGLGQYLPTIPAVVGAPRNGGAGLSYGISARLPSHRNLPLMFYGGSGGAASDTTAGTSAGAGGDGAPGCGGGGSGGTGSGAAVAQAPSGAGGPGFVWIFSF